MRKKDRVDREIEADIVRMERGEVEFMLLEVFDAYTRLCLAFKTYGKVLDAQIAFFRSMEREDAHEAANQVEAIIETTMGKLGEMTMQVLDSIHAQEEE